MLTELTRDDRVGFIRQVTARGNNRVPESIASDSRLKIAFREGQSELAEEYRNILPQSFALTAVALDEGIAEEAAALGARHNLRIPDAIQLATAIRSCASWFLTNDADLPALSEISVLVLKRLT